MCGESWLATKDLQPTAPVLKAGHPGVLFFVVGLFLVVYLFVLWLLDCLSGLGGWESIFTVF